MYVDTLSGAYALPLLFVVLAVALLVYQAINLLKREVQFFSARDSGLSDRWRQWSIKRWLQPLWDSAERTVSRQLLFSPDLLLSSYLLKKGIRKLYPAFYRVSSVAFYTALLVEASLLVWIIATLFFPGAAVQQSPDPHPYSRFPLWQPAGTGIVWTLYFIPLLIYGMHIMSRVPGIAGTRFADGLKNLYTYPDTFLALTLTLYATLLMTLSHILVPLSDSVAMDSHYHDMARHLATGFMVCVLMVYATWTRQGDCRWFFEQCKMSLFHPLFSCLMVGILFCFGFIVLTPPTSITMTIIALLLALLMLCVQLIYRSQIYSIYTQSFKVGLYVFVLLAMVYACLDWMTGFEMTLGTRKIVMVLVALVAGSFTVAWHVRWSAPRELSRKAQILSELDRRKQDMLFDVVATGDHLCVAGLLSLGADPASSDKKRDYLIHIAVKNGHNALIHTLLTFGADINAANKLGLRPIHIAASHVNFDILQTLLDNGANPHVKDMHGKTPLHRLCSQSRVIAGERQQRKLVQELLEQGLDPLEKDKLGKSAYDLAKKWNANGIAELMKQYMSR